MPDWSVDKASIAAEDCEETSFGCRHFRADERLGNQQIRPYTDAVLHSDHVLQPCRSQVVCSQWPHMRFFGERVPAGDWHQIDLSCILSQLGVCIAWHRVWSKALHADHLALLHGPKEVAVPVWQAWAGRQCASQVFVWLCWYAFWPWRGNSAEVCSFTLQPILNHWLLLQIIY